jgi:Protein of unknown function (DUF4127)
MKRVIVGLPVDGRPAVRSQVQALVACAGWQLRLPEVAALGHFRVPADRDALAQWLLDEGDAADGFVLSLDMLVYGGLVPSRFVPDELPALRRRLALVQALKARWPHKPVFAFAATMRISNNNVADEEKPYWADHGQQLWAWSYHGDRAAVTGDAVSAALARGAEAAIPARVREDYFATRQRNFEVNRSAVRMVGRGHIDRLVLPQDDTAEWGLNIAERRALQAEATGLGLQERVSICPGADEVMHTLCARLVSQLEGRAPLRVLLALSDPAHIGGLHALYEDRPVLESVASQVQAVDAVLADDGSSADALLALHTQGSAQGDHAMKRALPLSMPVAADWLARLRDWQQSGKPLLLADLAYANGGDPALLSQLGSPGHAGALPLPQAYAGWNTASNSLGSLLATAVLAQGRWHGAAAREALALRLLEDGLYQGVLRQSLRDSIDESRATPAELLAATRTAVIAPANAWAHAHHLGYRVVDVALPWGRSFEIDLHLEPTA